MNPYILPFAAINLSHLPQVGGKNASLGEMIGALSAKGIRVPDGFALTAQAFREFIEANQLGPKLENLLGRLDTREFANLQSIGHQARQLVLQATIPLAIQEAIRLAYRQLCAEYGPSAAVAVRSSATAEDLPSASFAGQHESYLNIAGEEQLIQTCLRCYASLFTNRAIKYRHDHGFDHMQVALSVGVQKMVRSDLSSAGVGFTIDPESGFSDVILITGAWGLGENVVQGAVNPDEFYVFKPTLRQGKEAIIGKKLGSKLKTMVYASPEEANKTIVNVDTPVQQQEIFVLSDAEITQLAQWSLQIEEHYGRPMDIEWAKDGQSGELFIVQARPETVHGKEAQSLKVNEFQLKESGPVLVRGNGIGKKITSGIARILNSPREAGKLQPGDVLVTDITNPDWDPILKRVSAIITNRGGRTSHAAIVARELGAVAVVGTGNATEVIEDGQRVTVCCADGNEGIVYSGKLAWEEKEVDFTHLQLPETQVMFILGDPDKAFQYARYPNKGVGLLRMEFIINNSIQIHPMALVKYPQLQDQSAMRQIEWLTRQYADKSQYFVDKLAQAVGTIAAAFYPKDVIVRMSDFKTNEYANLIGGREFEPEEENPMLGFRGASRYFGLECRAMKKVRDDMGLTNVKLMIPFCRTVEEGKKVLGIMQQYGLKRGVNGLEVYVMAEIPSNVILARQFAAVFDGFSIGSNDLTQLTLGIDRDSSTVSELFNENDPAARQMIASVIRTAKETGTKIGLCGQAPSDFPEYARFLVSEGIDSISFNPDALLKGLENVIAAERKVRKTTEVPAAAN
jgi:pyruvate, water dikinase